MQQYYTLEQAAQILRINPEQLKEMARKKELRAFQDRSGWRFRAQEIDEMARTRGYGSDPELPLGEGAKGKGGDAVFNFSLDPNESSEVPLGKEPAGADKPSRSPTPSRKTSGSKSPTPKKASSDSDVRLVMEGSNLDFSLDDEDNNPSLKAPVSPTPKKGSSKSRMAPIVQDDSGVRIVPLDKPSDSDVKIVASSPHDSDIPLGHQPPKKPSDSDIRIEEVPRGGKGDQMVTEEIDLDAEERKAEAARAKGKRNRPKPGSSSVLPTVSPFELSEKDLEGDGSAARKPQETDAETDSSSDFELKPLDDSSSPLELGSDEEVSLGELTGSKGHTGINLQDPADSGISLEQQGSDEMDIDLSTAADRTPKPTTGDDVDSSNDFELSVRDDDSSPTEGSSSDFELSLQDDDASPTEGSSSEFELSLDTEGSSELALDEGSSDLVLEAPGSDSDSEFELTLDEGGGLSVEEDSGEQSKDVLETDFEVPSLDEDSSSEAVALDESGSDLESSEFDLALEGEESGSQVVPLEEVEESDEGAATVQRKAAGVAALDDEEGAEDIGGALDEDLDAEPALEEEEGVEPAVVAAAAPPADWGVAVPIASLVCTIVLFLVALMSFELIQGMWGYHSGTKVSNMIIHPLAKAISGEDNLPDN